MPYIYLYSKAGIRQITVFLNPFLQKFFNKFLISV